MVLFETKLILSTKTFRMVINLSKVFLQTQSFFIVGNQKQMLFVLEKIGLKETKLLNFKRSSKTLTQDTKPISNYIYPVTLCHLFPLNLLISNDWHREKPLGYSVFAEPNYLFTQHIYLVACLATMLQVSWDIAEGK